MEITIRSAREIEIMRQAGRIVAETLALLAERVRPGVTTRELDALTQRTITKQGATPSFKGYRGYPASLCVSINDEVVHGIPGDRVIEEGDIVSLDFGAYVNGFHGDAAVTVGAGKINSKAKELLDVTEAALLAGIKAARCGAYLGDVSAAIQSYVETRGFSVVREYCGHGIGRDLHEDPQVPNFGLPGNGQILKQGVTLALEPMVTTGDWRRGGGDQRWE